VRARVRFSFLSVGVVCLTCRVGSCVIEVSEGFRR
jgi:hypothetical protein